MYYITTADFFYQNFIPSSFDYSKKAAILWGKCIADRFREQKKVSPKYIPRVLKTKFGPKTIYVASYPKSFFLQFYQPIKRWMEMINYDLQKLEKEKVLCDCKLRHFVSLVR